MDKDKRIEILKNRLRNEADAREQLEIVIHERTTKLINSHAFIKDMFDTLPGGVAVVASNGIVKNSNVFLSNLLTDEDEGVIGMGIENFFKRNPNKAFPLKGSAPHFNDQEEYYFDLITTKKEQIPVTCRCSTIKDEDDEESCLFVITNLSELKKSEDEKYMLQNKLIEVSYKEGVAENAISVLHNIGNKLTSILSSLSQARRDDQIPVIEKGINKLVLDINQLKTQKDIVDFFFTQENTHKISKIFEILVQNSKAQEQHLYKVEDLCNELSLIVEKQRELADLKGSSKGQVDLSEIVMSCLKIHEDFMSKEEIVVEFEKSSDVFVYCEKLGLTQVLSNIILNSIEAINSGARKSNKEEKLIEISIREITTAVTLSIKDNGVGICKNNQKKVCRSGFTTKKMKAGLSLHNACNYMNNNDGIALLI